MGDGGTIAKLGQKQLNLVDNVVGSDVQSIFQSRGPVVGGEDL